MNKEEIIKNTKLCKLFTQAKYTHGEPFSIRFSISNIDIEDNKDNIQNYITQSLADSLDEKVARTLHKISGTKTETLSTSEILDIKYKKIGFYSSVQKYIDYVSEKPNRDYLLRDSIHLDFIRDDDRHFYLFPLSWILMSCDIEERMENGTLHIEISGEVCDVSKHIIIEEFRSA